MRCGNDGRSSQCLAHCMTMFSLNKTGATIMTTTGTTTRLSDGARLPRVRSGLNVRNHNSTRVRGRGLHLNHNVTAVIARKPQVKQR